MTKLKNKLFASVRQAQGIQADSVEAKKIVKRAAPKPAPKAASKASPKVAPKVALAAPARQQSAPRRNTVAAPVETGSALFPARVWPD